MELRRKHYIIITVLVIVSAVLYEGVKDWIGASQSRESALGPQVKSDIPYLMEAMNIRQLGTPETPPDFSLLSLEGDHIRLSQHRGKVVLVSFWATW
jgi:hypothetical protein